MSCDIKKETAKRIGHPEPEPEKQPAPEIPLEPNRVPVR